MKSSRVSTEWTQLADGASARYSIFSSVTIHLEISGGCVLKLPLSSTVNGVDERICAVEPPNRYDLSRRFSQLLRPFSRKLQSTRFERRIRSLRAKSENSEIRSEFGKKMNFHEHVKRMPGTRESNEQSVFRSCTRVYFHTLFSCRRD